jgi:hypothetical protein
MPLLTAFYSIIGLIYLDWGVFHIVYLFWFENLVRVISYRFKINTLEYVSLSGQIQKTRENNGKISGSLTSIFYTRLFMYFAYFVFIVIGLGIVLPMLETDSNSNIKGIYNFVRVFTFRVWDFNLALLACILDEFTSYIRDFKKNKRYNFENPYRVPVPFEKEDVILHLSIIFSTVFAFFVKHPDSPVVGFVAISPMIVAGVLLVLLILGFQLFLANKELNKSNRVDSDKTMISERIKDLQKP